MPDTVSLSRKEQIEQVARRLFREQGYAATSMRDIAQAMELEVSSLYNHFTSKEEILQHICFGMAGAFFDSIGETETLGVFPDEKLRLAVISHVKVLTSSLDAAAVFVNEWRSMTGNHLSEFMQLRDRYEQIFRNIIREGIQKQTFKEIDERFVTLMIFSAVNWIYNWYKPGGRMTPEEIGENLCGLILNGLMK